MRKFIFFLFVTPSLINAQESATDYFLIHPASACNLAMGESLVASSGGVESVKNNPAGLAGMASQGALHLTRRPPQQNPLFFGDDYSRYHYFTAAWRYNVSNTFAIQYNDADFFALENLPPGQGAGDDRYTATVYGITWAHQLTNTLHFGITGKRIISRYYNTATSFAGDVGLLFHKKEILRNQRLVGDLNLAASLSHVGQGIAYIVESQKDPLPRHLQAGFVFSAHSARKHAQLTNPLWGARLAASYQKSLQPDNEKWEWGTGAEIDLLQLVFVRIGYHAVRPAIPGLLPKKTFETGVAWGGGLRIPIAKILNSGIPLTCRFDFSSSPQGTYIERYSMYSVIFEYR
ncbi:MAG: hypothetical protein DWQ10_08790 [Calditrichaeota bacterium]|nr:MAG: hypothetical protein DWQ10_08790 [Calditrichota bacterium]